MLTAALASLGALAIALPASAAALPSCTTPHWVGSWASSPSDGASGADLYGSLPVASLANQS